MVAGSSCAKLIWLELSKVEKSVRIHQTNVRPCPELNLVVWPFPRSSTITSLIWRPLLCLLSRFLVSGWVCWRQVSTEDSQDLPQKWRRNSNSNQQHPSCDGCCWLVVFYDQAHLPRSLCLITMLEKLTLVLTQCPHGAHCMLRQRYRLTPFLHSCISALLFSCLYIQLALRWYPTSNKNWSLVQMVVELKST